LTIIVSLCLVFASYGRSNTNNIPLDYDLPVKPTDVLPQSVRLDVPTTPEAPMFCYLESISMILAYLDNSITTAEVFAFSGLGAQTVYSAYHSALIANDVWTHELQIRAHQNYNVSWVVGYVKGSNDGGYFNGTGAIGKIIFDSQDALNNLKAILASGYPVQVHLDLYYIRDQIPKYSTGHFSPGASHFMAVTGYDQNYIYVNETIQPETDGSDVKDIPVTIGSFLNAWSWQGHGYWLLFIPSTSVSKRPFSEILNWQRELAANTPSDIRRFASDLSTGKVNVPEGYYFSKLYHVKRLFSEFLGSNKYYKAADLYSQIATKYNSCFSATALEIANTLNEIADLEEQAITAISKPIPIPDIKANNSNGSITLGQSDNLTLSIALNNNGQTDNADWWLAANTPFGWYYYDAYEGSWLSGLSFTYQGPLFDLALVEVLNIAGLPVGTYIFYFGIDTDMNGSLDYDQLYYDAVEVNFSDLIENTTRSGHIYSNELWKGTIDITGDVIIHTPATVTIEPETTIRFAAGSDDQMHGGDTPITDPYFPNDPPTPPSQISSIYVMSGTLYAVGTSDSPIVFTSSASNPERGDWQSIQYGKEGGKLILQHTIIEYGYYGVQINVAADDSNITLKDNIIRHIVACGICGGIDPSQPVTITISGNDISDCGHEAIDTHSNATLVIENNTLHDNLWSYGDGKAGAGVVIDGNNSTIRNNQFIRNRTAIAILTENSHPIISGNSFVDNDLDCDGFCPDPLQ